MTVTVRRLVAALVVAGTTAGALGVPAAHAAPSSVTQPTVTRSAPAARPDAASTQYVAAVRVGSQVRLQLVDRTSGRVLRTLATATPRPGQDVRDVFGAAAIGADGTVWAVRGTTLLRITGTTVQSFMPHVTDVVVSPDGTRIAYVVDSPDVDHDGYATISVRSIAASGRGPQTVLASTRYRVDRAGHQIGLVDRYRLWGWVDGGHVAVSVGSQDEYDVSVICASRPVAQRAWTRWHVSFEATAFARDRAGRLVVATPAGNGWRVAALTAAAPRGAAITTVRGAYAGDLRPLAAWARAAGARVVNPAVASPAYRGPGAPVVVALPR